MAPKAETPVTDLGPPPSTAEEAQTMVDRAAQEIQLALGGPAFASPPSVPAPGEEQPGAAPPPPPIPPPRVAQAEAAPAEPTASGAITAHASDPCSNACRALASMERATLHLCGLAGEADARCSGARARVKDASARVHAQCPSCTP